jgi:photosystem II stability/assembly factor-like uncharacterized protein
MYRAATCIAACILCVLALACSGCARQQPEIRWEALPIGTDASFEDLWFADSLHGWIVGGSYQIDGGLVGRTRDGGLTWEYSSGMFGSTPRLHVQGVWFLDRSRGFVTTKNGMIYRTQDGGDTWNLVHYGRGSIDHLFDFDFVDERNGFAAGGAGVVRTVDGGANWFPASGLPPLEARVDAWAVDFVDTRTGWIAGQHGRLMRTDDGGATWQHAVTPLNRDDQVFLFDIQFLDRDTGWVVGSEGTILHTTDGGATWGRVETGIPGARSEHVPEIIERRAGVRDTIDTGQHTPGLFLTGVRFVDANRGWVVGYFGYEGRSIVLRTEDAGATWGVEGDVQGEELRALFVLDPDHAWTVGDRNRPGPQMLLRYRAGSGAARG